MKYNKEQETKKVRELENKRRRRKILSYEELQTIIAFEQRCRAESYEDYPDTFKEMYVASGFPVESFYVDQGINSTVLGDRMITSFNLPLGIKWIDKWFSQRIMKRDYDPVFLEKLIRRNPHLHNVIKTNLINNLNNYERTIDNIKRSH